MDEAKISSSVNEIVEVNAGRAAMLSQKVAEFHKDHQLNWVDDFCDAVCDVAETRFYRGVSKVIRAFVHMETDVIADMVEASDALAASAAA